jgi:membrane protein DedA with SNARE-associated domain
MLEHLPQYGYLLVFLGTIVEMDATILAAAFLAHQGHLNLLAVMAVAASASIASSQTYYALARKHGRGLMAKPGNRMVQRVRSGVDRHGVLLLLASRFMFGFRIAIPAACGAAGMPKFRFLWTNVLGAVLWVGIFGSLGYFGSQLTTRILGDLRRNELSIAIAVAVFVSVLVFWRNRGLDLVETRIAFEHPEQLPEHAVNAVNAAADHAGLVSTLMKEK